MKILILMTGSYPPKEGIGSYVYNLTNRLAKNKNNEITILTRNRGANKRFEEVINNIRVISVPIIKFPVIGLFHFRNLISKEFRNISFDVIHYNSPLMFFVPSLKTQKNIVTIHSTMKVSVKYLEPLNLVTLLKIIMGRLVSPFLELSLINNCDSIITVSEATTKELFDIYKIKKNKKIYFIPNCIDNEIFKPNYLPKINQLCTIGRLDYGKGVIELLEAINQIKFILRQKDFKFIFVGDGPLKELLEKNIDQYKINDIVQIINHLSQNEISKILNQSFYSIINSKYETGPRTAIESMAVATPVISTPVGLLEHRVHESIFIEIKKHNNSIKKAILEGLDIINTDCYNELKQNSLLFSERYYCVNIKIKIEDIYEK